MTPEELLFLNPETKVYDSQTELALRILEVPNSNFQSFKPASFKSLLSKTIRGERRLSVKLKEAILNAIESDGEITKTKTNLIKEKLDIVFDEAYSEYSVLKKFQDDKRISTKLFIDLEMNTKNVELNCITTNLNWTIKHLDAIVKSAKENNCIYKYLVFDFQAALNINFLEERIKEEKLENAIMVKKAYKSVGLYNLDSKKLIDTYSILFPLFEDLVIYKNIPEKLREIFSIKNSEIVVMGSTIYDENYDRLYDDFIMDDGSRIKATVSYFNKVWDACE